MLAFLPIAVLLVSTDLLTPQGSPTETESSMNLSMPGDNPIEWIVPAEGIGFALVMRGELVKADPDRVVLRRRGEEVDAEILLSPETSILFDGRSTTFDRLPIGGNVEVTFDLRGAERVALEIVVSPPGKEVQGEAAAPIIPVVPGARLENGLPPSASPAAPPQEEPRSP